MPSSTSVQWAIRCPQSLQVTVTTGPLCDHSPRSSDLSRPAAEVRDTEIDCDTCRGVFSR